MSKFSHEAAAAADDAAANDGRHGYDNLSTFSSKTAELKTYCRNRQGKELR